MGTSKPERREAIIAGLGGLGVLTIGQALAEAGKAVYSNVLYFPSYAIAMRGGASECTVILSQDRIASPWLSQADAVLVLAPSEAAIYANRTRRGGILMVESEGLKNGKLAPEGVKLIKVPALKLASEMGRSQIANFVLFGAYIAASSALPVAIVEQELQQKYGGRKEVLAQNLQAFRRGVKFITGGS